MMHMTFYWSKEVTLLFDFWRTDSWLSYFFTLLACFLFSAFHQYMEDHRRRLLSLPFFRSPPPHSAAGAPLIPGSSDPVARSVVRTASAMHFGVNAAMGYLLMLAVMSFNAGVFVAVVLGLTVGYLVFRSAGDIASPVIYAVEPPRTVVRSGSF